MRDIIGVLSSKTGERIKIKRRSDVNGFGNGYFFNQRHTKITSKRLYKPVYTSLIDYYSKDDITRMAREFMMENSDYELILGDFERATESNRNPEPEQTPKSEQLLNLNGCEYTIGGVKFTVHKGTNTKNGKQQYFIPSLGGTAGQNLIKSIGGEGLSGSAWEYERVDKAEFFSKVFGLNPEDNCYLGNFPEMSAHSMLKVINKLQKAYKGVDINYTFVNLPESKNEHEGLSEQKVQKSEPALSYSERDSVLIGPYWFQVKASTTEENHYYLKLTSEPGTPPFSWGDVFHYAYKNKERLRTYFGLSKESTLEGIFPEMTLVDLNVAIPTLKKDFNEGQLYKYEFGSTKVTKEHANTEGDLFSYRDTDIVIKREPKTKQDILEVKQVYVPRKLRK